MMGGAFERVRFAVTGVFALVSVLCAFGNENACLHNERMSICFDASGNLADLADRANSYDFVDSGAGGLWHLAFEGARTIVPADAMRLDFSGDHETTTLIWKEFAAPGLESLRVTVTVTLREKSPTSEWTLRVDGLDDARLEEVRFPVLGDLTEQANEVLAVPVWMGEAVSDPRTALAGGGPVRRHEWENPGLLSLQCLALYGKEGPGLMLASDDSAAFRKRFAVLRDADRGLGLDIAHLPDGTAGGSYSTPYSCLVSVFDGDWFTAAEMYRGWEWSKAQAAKSRMDQGQTPAWVTGTGLWVWNRGVSANVLGPAAALQEAAGMPVSVFWHWWHGCPYDVGFPEYLPPREGTEPFKDAVEKAHERGLHAIVYMNQRLWGTTTASWESKGAAAFAVKGTDGQIRPEVYNTFTQSPCAAMCMGTSFWRDTYKDLAVEASQSLGVDGIYMDQACATLSCYDPSHGHTLGGGTYWIEGFRTLSEGIRQKSPGIGLAGEGCGEQWLPYLDMMLMLQVSKERYSGPNQREPIPFFQAVYGGHAVFYGNYSSLTMPPYDELWPAEFAPEEPLRLLDQKFSTQFRLEQARAFVWGQQPTIANFRPEHLESRPEEMAFALKLARLRHEALEYLQYGQMLRAPAVDVPEVTLPMSRLSIYAGQREGLKEFEASYPAVMASAWKARDGSVAVAMVNISDAEQTFDLKLARAEYGLAERGVVNTHGDVSGPAAAYEGDLSTRVVLAAQGAAVIIVGE